MKRFISLSLMTVMLLTISACGGREIIEDNTSETTTATTEATTAGNVTESTTASTSDAGGTGDFAIDNPTWFWIKWDADGDGTEEDVEFRYYDNGDEAPSVIEVTIYKGNDQITGYMDRAYGINKIYSKKGDDGPYLYIFYDQGDYYNTAPAECTLELNGDKIDITETIQD